MITNLHNPTSVLTPDWVLQEIGDIARSIGALVLVDEVYLDAVYERHAANIIPSRARIRCDQQPDESLRRQWTAMWLDLGPPDLAWKMRRLNDLYSATPVHPGQLLASLCSSILIVFAKRRAGLLRPIANFFAIFWQSNQAFLPFRQIGARLHSRDWNGNADDFLERLAIRIRHLSSSRPLLRNARSFSHRHGREHRNVR